jgi:regulator of PEP synthase PpsR (kinase-PPPase family)
MINMVNKYALELDIIQATSNKDYPDTYLIESEYEFYEVFAIDMIQKLYDVLDEYIQEDDDPIIYKDYMIIKDYLELYNAINY